MSTLGRRSGLTGLRAIGSLILGLILTSKM